MQQTGYGPDKMLKIKVTTRDLPVFRDTAVLLIDQMKHVYIDGELELVDTPQYYPKILRKDFTVALNLQTSGPDPDPILQLFYSCGSSLNWDGYCNPDIDKLIDQQSREADPDRRKHVLWEIERSLAADDARPIILYTRGGTCRQPYVKGLTLMVNSIFNGWRMEDLWLETNSGVWRSRSRDRPNRTRHAIVKPRALRTVRRWSGEEAWDPIWCVVSA